MDAHEGSVGVGVGNAGPVPKRDEDIGGAGHDHMIAAGLEQRFDTSRHIEGQHLLGESPDGFGTVVIAPVTRIQDHGVEIGEARPLLEESATGQQQRGQQRQAS